MIKKINDFKGYFLINILTQFREEARSNYAYFPILILLAVMLGVSAGMSNLFRLIVAMFELLLLVSYLMDTQAVIRKKIKIGPFFAAYSIFVFIVNSLIFIYLGAGTYLIFFCFSILLVCLPIIHQFFIKN